MKPLRRQRSAEKLGLVSVLLLASLSTYFVQQTACSSYLDLLPTAKLALSKLQQTLAPATTLSSPVQAREQPPQQVDSGASSNATDPQTTTPAAAAAAEPEADEATAAQSANQNEDNQNNSNDIDSDSSTNNNNKSHELPGGSDSMLANEPSTLVPPPQSSTSQPSASEEPLVISSTAATDSDPISGTASSDSGALAAESSNFREANEQIAPASTVTSPSPPTTTTTTAAAATNEQAAANSGAQSNSVVGLDGQSDPSGPGQLPALVVDGSVVSPSRPDEASVRETELAAVAAVDASIGFGSAVGDLFGATADTCYDEYGNARYCEPEFENIAFERPIEVSSECGSPASRFCTAYMNENSDVIRNCHICDAKHPKKRHPAAYLSDLNDPNNPTCWVSAPLGGVGGGQQLQRDNVSLTLNLNKMYEITYISVQFCSARPDSMAIYKSSDYGQNWQAYQYYSSNCRQVYNRPTSSGRAAGDLSAICTNYNNGGASSQQTSTLSSSSNATLSSSQVNSGQQTQLPAAAASHWTSNRVAFSTLEGARGKLAGVAGTDPAAQLAQASGASDWTSATSVRVVLDRNQPAATAGSMLGSAGLAPMKPPTQAKNVRSSAAASTQLRNSNETTTTTTEWVANLQQQPTGATPPPPPPTSNPSSQLTNPSDTYNYAIADLVVGGRCKCNGHASKCTHSSDGRLQCDCRHNTAGRDCEKCAPFHFDRPWKPATQMDANPCQPCNCNGHSRKCRFDLELYELSGARSGGVCINCRDNTAGRHCHYCKEGFTRDLSKPMTDKEACRECDCHPLGSLGRVCNQTTGQCPCKEGVTGLQCTRCAPGYQQSSSPSEPCIKLPENDINYEPSLVVDSDPTSTLSSQSSPETTEIVSANDAASNGNNNADNNQDSATPGGSRTNDNKQYNNNNKPYLSSPDDSPPISLDQSNEADDNQLALDEFNSLAARKRAQQQHQQRQWLMRNYHQRHRYAPPLDESAGVDEPSVKPDDQELYMQAARPRNQPFMMDIDEDLAGAYGTSNGAYNNDNYARSMYNRWPQMQVDTLTGYRRRQQSMQARNRGGSSMADDSYDDQMGSLGLDSYPSLPLDDAATFNLISPTTRRRINNYSNRAQRKQQAQSGRRRPIGGGSGEDEPSSPPSASISHVTRHQSVASPVPSLVSCGDCQNNTRRMSSRQFCHLDYAIKATILSRHRAVDWTRFDVEIIDIFKSPQLRSNPMIMPMINAGSNYIDNMVQADEPTTMTNKSSGNGNNNNRPSTTSISNSNAGNTNIPKSMDQRPAMLLNNNLQQQQQQQSTPIFHHRLRVGTVQPIWIPTEDLSCNCPRLKPRSTYLLMGLVDNKENSANSIQLDRHSVALEWRSILQEKLIRYQRRYARGRC